MNKLIILSLVVGGYIFAGIHNETDNSNNQSTAENFSWVIGSSEDDLNADAGRRRGRGHRKDRCRGSGGLR